MKKKKPKKEPEVCGHDISIDKEFQEADTREVYSEYKSLEGRAER